ncbi:unnamed protein product [Prorocentrum cordatum]|uniref:Uncharacterized protein n=1 Tax=Prorocentrum cordatum TaxID=2364126 RepID=A0ABN9SQF5_9DINO|nr:unnamed protein product [Polarella glacialis]
MYERYKDEILFVGISSFEDFPLPPPNPYSGKFPKDKYVGPRALRAGRGQRRMALGSRPPVAMRPAPPRTDWFRELLGFREVDEATVKANLRLEGSTLHSKANGKSFEVGVFSTPSLEELREQGRRALAEAGAAALAAASLAGAPAVRHAFGDAAELHAQGENRRALFQVASQFNCLEFVGPSCTPEMGVTGYASDRTQGPCCAIACGAGTVYRNYLAPVRDPSGGPPREGQRADSQIECLRDLTGELAGGEAAPPAGYFRVRGGYTLAEDRGLRSLNDKLGKLSEVELDRLRSKLRVGVQQDLQVTSTSWGSRQLRDPEQLVTQAFCSACSVAYSRNGTALWEPFARLVLEASYEATLWAAVASALAHNGLLGSRRVFLTAVGGGVFGNSMEWVAAAIDRAVEKVCLSNRIALDIFLVSYASPADRWFEALVRRHGADRASAVASAHPPVPHGGRAPADRRGPEAAAAVAPAARPGAAEARGEGARGRPHSDGDAADRRGHEAAAAAASAARPGAAEEGARVRCGVRREDIARLFAPRGARAAGDGGGAGASSREALERLGKRPSGDDVEVVAVSKRPRALDDRQEGVSAAEVAPRTTAPAAAASAPAAGSALGPTSRRVVWLSVNPTGGIDLYPGNVALKLEAAVEKATLDAKTIKVSLSGLGAFPDGAIIEVGASGRPLVQLTRGGARDVRRLELATDSQDARVLVAKSAGAAGAWKISDEAVPGVTEERRVVLPPVWRVF